MSDPGAPGASESSAADRQASGLTDEEAEHAAAKLGRTPNDLERAIFDALWSEHCSYKSTRALLSKLPRSAPWVLQGPGENAGAIDIGDGLAAVFKIESHNHPSLIEPHEGAATGVGGILRDVAAMGARPVAILNALFVGPLEAEQTRRRLEGIVAGVGAYGNAFGVPTVGGQTTFDIGYEANILVNAMAVGVVDKMKLASAAARAAGLDVALIGAPTGRDGVRGAQMASASFDGGVEDLRPAVQVADPFAGKRMIDVCLEIIGVDAAAALQDLGAAGLASACAETAAKGGRGLALDIASVPRREEDMSADEVVLSETQERMLIVLRPGREDDVRSICERHEVPFAIVAKTTDDGDFTVSNGDETLARIPAKLLSEGAPPREVAPASPARIDPLADPELTYAEARAVLQAPKEGASEFENVVDAFLEDRVLAGDAVDAAATTLWNGAAEIYWRYAPDVTADISSIEEAATNLKASNLIGDADVVVSTASVNLAEGAGPHSLLTALAKLMATSALCSRAPVYEQFDSDVRGLTMLGPDGDAGLVQVEGTMRGLALSVDVTPRYVSAAPSEGAKQAVAECYRNICATGAAPLAITNCLNFASPAEGDVARDIIGVIDGLAEVCEALNLPVVSGNVSLNNESDGVRIPPTPVVGAVGVLEDVSKFARPDAAFAGDELIAIGVTRGLLGRSLYLKELFGVDAGPPPPVDPDAERRNGELVRKLIADGVVAACRDVSDGGLIAAAVELAIASGEGLDLATPVKQRRAAFWFGEDQGRYLVAVAPGAADTVLLKAAMAGVQAARLGRFGGDFVTLDGDDAIGLIDFAGLRDAPLETFFDPAQDSGKEAAPMPMAADDIKKMLLDAMPDAEISIEDLAGDGDHYRARIVSAAFNGKNRVQQHQLVYKALKGKMGGELHALALETEARE